MNIDAARMVAQLDKELAQECLIDFILATYPGYSAGWFHRSVCDELDRFLDAVLAQESPRLMLFAPPRSGKSEIVSRRFPAYTLGKHPDLSLIATSYGADLASAMNRDVQRVIDQPEYATIFPATRLFADNVRTVAQGSWLRNSDIFEIVGRKGVYKSSGVGGGITGRGGHVCLPAGTMVETSEGPVAIQDLDATRPRAMILAYDGSASLEFKDLQALVRREADGLYRITTALGRVVEATGDHPFLSGARYVPADSLAPGDPLLLAVRDEVLGARAHAEQAREEWAQGPLLLGGVLGGPSRDEEPSAVRDVRGAVLSQGGGLVFGAPATAQAPDARLSASPGDVPHVQRHLPVGASGAGRVRDLLLDGVFREGALPAHGGQGQPEVEARRDASAAAAPFREGVPAGAAPRPGPGRDGLRGLSSEGRAPGGSPHRQLADEQRGVEPRLPLLAVSPGVARGEGFTAVRDSVALVERVRGPAVVYDIQVADHHNFFANGICVSNCIVDDPIKDAEQADSPVYREKVWDWFRSTLYTRLAPGGGILLIQCMAGDTPVLMADATERPLARVRQGDRIATYRDGRLSTSTVRNWASQGFDAIYEIRTRSGRLLRANERHPFLVCRNGEPRWVKLKGLRAGDLLVGVSGVGSGAAPTDAGGQPSAGGSARRTTTKTVGRAESARRPTTRPLSRRLDSSTVTASTSTSTTPCSSGSAASAPSASSHHPGKTRERTGTGSSASITTTRPGGCAGCSATTATSQSGTARRPRTSSEPLSTYAIAHDEIVEIASAGSAEVFDVQVDGTENFIANGCVAHNTRWHEDDLAGRILEAHKKGEGEEWKVVSYPAVAEIDEPHRKAGEALHPERYPLADLVGEDGHGGIRRAVGARVWASLYQQRPAAAEGAILKRAYWKYYRPTSSDPATLVKELGITSVVQVWDTAFKEKAQNDPSACMTFGLSPSKYFILDVWTGKVEYPDLKRTAIAQHAKWKPHAVLIEDKASGQSLIQELRRETVIPVLPIQVDRDKVARANAISPQLEAGLVYLPEAAPWVADFVDECATFPNAAHDDQVDTLTMALDYARKNAGGMGVMEFMRQEAARAVAAKGTPAPTPTVDRPVLSLLDRR